MVIAETSPEFDLVMPMKSLHDLVGDESGQAVEKFSGRMLRRYQHARCRCESACSNSLCLGHRSPDAHTWDARLCAFRAIQAQCTCLCLRHNRVVVAAAQPARECSRLRADRERTLLVLAQPPHRIERNPFDRDGKGLTEEFCESKALTLRKLFLLFLSTATFAYQVPLFTAGPFVSYLILSINSYKSRIESH